MITANGEGDAWTGAANGETVFDRGGGDGREGGREGGELGALMEKVMSFYSPRTYVGSIYT